jgi:glycosyltransferase involved in cell wall biosynthesis
VLSITKRILILLENESFPFDTRVRREADTLVEAGYELTVICPTRPYHPEREILLDGVRVLRFAAPPPAHGVMGYLREYLLACTRIARILLRLRKETVFAAVITCNPPDFMILLPRFLLRSRPGLVFDYHDLSPELFEEVFRRRGIFYQLLVWIERLGLRIADVVITVNHPCADIVQKRGRVSPGRVFVVANYPDPRRLFPVEPRPELRNGFAHLVLWIGTMSARAGREEGLHVLLEAAHELVYVRRRADVVFKIIGSGEIYADIAAEVLRRGLENVVFLPGEVDVDEVRAYIATADVCLSLDKPSPMTDKALVVKVLEYMIMERAVIQTPLEEMRRICGDATVYTRDTTGHELAERISALLDDTQARVGLGRAARERVLDGLTWSHQIPTLVEAVERAISLSTRGPNA